MPLRTPYHMLMRALPLASVGAGRAALLLIDVQKFTALRGQGLDAEAARRGITGEFADYYAQVAAALRNIERLLAACRAKEIAAFHIRVADTGSLSRQFRLSGLERPPADSPDETLPQAAPSLGEPVIERGAYSVFHSTDLEQKLHHQGVETLIIAGMMANVTVALAAREAADRSFDVLVVQDASASETREWHALAMQGLGGGAIRVLWTEDVLELIDGAVR
jgi:nicotinamidase-related amidase